MSYWFFWFDCMAMHGFNSRVTYLLKFKGDLGSVICLKIYNYSILVSDSQNNIGFD